MKKKVIICFLLPFLLFFLPAASQALASVPATPLSKNQSVNQENNKKWLEEFDLTLNSFYLRNKSLSGHNKFDINFKLSPSPTLPGFMITDPVEFHRLTSQPPNRPRATIELLTLMTISGADYWHTYSKFLEDWQYRPVWRDQKKRFFSFQAYRFDHNNFNLNWRHSLAGMVYYELARSNNLPWWNSMLYSLGGSLYWEYIVEWREVVSISDNITTGFGGYVLGESWFQIGRYFLNSPRKTSYYLSWLNPFNIINGRLEGDKPLSPHFHPFNYQAQDVFLFLGYRNSPTSTSNGNKGNMFFRFGSEIFTEPVYGLPGKVTETFNNPIYTQLNFSLTYHGKTQEELELQARVIPWGKFVQKISEDKRGYSLIYGLGSAFHTYVKRPVTDYDAGHVKITDTAGFHFEEPRNFRDKMGSVHLLGPVFDGTFYASDWSFRFSSEAYVSFGMINALALNKYSLDHDVQGMKTTLTCYGYHYALGPALGATAEIAHSPFRLRGFASYIYYRSIQGLAELQYEMTDDSVVKDSRWHTGFQLQWHLPINNLSLFSSIEWVGRWGIVHEVTDRTLEKRYYLGLKYNF
ncbi:MAG TPA: DUF3943 domain-containing protein [Candidatus Saccharicenans sp.]|jgi:hypothetical protein|nr:DUF3943 domain-containing protein [Candidatus Saccharicenans sp.]HRD02011.1 DUF3943 domain-containing protein [Candidatus Saccharicenans sp.]